MENILERKRQDVCSGCGKAIMDAEKECAHCGAFPHRHITREQQLKH